MLVEHIEGNINDIDIKEYHVDYVSIDWYEVEKKILHKVSEGGMEVGIRNNGEPLRDGDILWKEDKKAVVVRIPECQCIALNPTNMMEMGKACYEIGNRHAPLYMEDGELLTPMDEPLMRILEKNGFAPYQKMGKLITPLGGHEHEGHGHSHGH